MSNQMLDIDEILERYPGQPQYLISLLQDIQAEYHYISPECLRLACDHVGVPLTRAWSVATFYRSFSLEPRGEHEIRVCQGTACHLRNAQRLVDALEEALQVKAGQTTEDLRFSLDTVNCLGACALSPVVMIDQDYLGRATAGAVKRKIRQLEKAEGDQP